MAKKNKVILSIFLALVIFFVSSIVYFEIEPENTNADTHLNYDKHFDSSVWVIAEACDVEKPLVYLLCR